ncbi:ABC transporter substrate-binding protein [Paraburkholderia dilworthii]|uniref:ABC transporter substrate-binding protein n=1 Tax=Paraburkholderia dilworthii TaxID=948106 RepID=A0ABW9DGH9_9BURK
MKGGGSSARVALPRRVCLKAIAAAALGIAATAHGATPAAGMRPPRRIIVLNWDLTEMLLSLGVTPVGVPAPAWYVSSVVVPPLPAGVVDIGLLFQPNYDLLYELRPDLIVITPAHASVQASFERIAPTLMLGAYTTAPQPYRAMRDEAMTLARRLGVVARAEALLNETADVLTQSRAALDAAAPAGGYRSVYVAQIVDDRHLRVFGAGSMFDGILRTLGLRNAAVAASARVGSGFVAGQNAHAIVELDRLATVPDACVLWVGSSVSDDMTALQLNPVWRQLPFSQPGRTAALPVISATGALISVQRFARAVVSAMPGLHVI